MDKAGITDVKLEVFEAQQEIIRLYSDVTNLLFRLLTLHTDVDEAETLEAVSKINDTAMLRAEHQL